MIRFRNQVFEDYFIDPKTAVITDKNGKIKHQTLNKGSMCIVIKKQRMAVHQIQAHTAWGYSEDKVVHHIDGNHLNNVLSNLDYSMTQAEHAKKHLIGHKRSDEYKETLSEAMISYYKTHEHPNKNRVYKKGVRHCSEETKQRMKLAALLREARKREEKFKNAINKGI